MSSSRTISANGIEIFLLEEGEGPLVVLCHGWPELSYSWRHQIPAIADAGFHVVAPDMRGFGRSSAPAEIDAYSIFDNVGDMVALVTALGEKQAVIVGHDWGAPVAWHAALFRPDMFTKVAGLSVPPPFRGRARPLGAAGAPGSGQRGLDCFLAELVQPAPAQHFAGAVWIDRQIGRAWGRIVRVVLVGHGARIFEHSATGSAGRRHFRGRIDRGVVGRTVAEAVGAAFRHRNFAADPARRGDFGNEWPGRRDSDRGR